MSRGEVSTDNVGPSPFLLGRKRLARPTKYTPERREKLLTALRDGNTHRAACAQGCIDQGTFIDWQRRYPDFANAVKRAEAEAELKHVANITKASETNWTASAWWLERRFPDDWGRKDRLDIRLLLDRERERVRTDAEAAGLDADLAVAEFERIIREARASA